LSTESHTGDSDAQDYRSGGRAAESRVVGESLPTDDVDGARSKRESHAGAESEPAQLSCSPIVGIGRDHAVFTDS
jgi:hypothetical protein